MDTISEEFNKQVNGAFKVIDSNRVFSTVLGLFLALYASLAAPSLPKSITNIFKSTWFRLIFMFLIAYISTKNPSVAIISAVALLVTLQTLHAQETTNTILKSVEKKIVDNFENFDDVEGIPSVDDLDKITEYESVSSEDSTDLLTSDDLLNTKEKKINKNNNVELPKVDKEIRVDVSTRNEIINVIVPNVPNVPSEKPNVPSELNPEIINISIPSESVDIPMAMYIEKPQNNENITISVPSEKNSLNNIKLNNKKQVVFARAEEEQRKNKVVINIDNNINDDDDDDDNDEDDEEEDNKNKNKNKNKQVEVEEEEEEDNIEKDVIDLVLGFENIESFSPIKNTNLGVTKSCLTNKCFTKKENFNNSESNGSCKDILSTIPGFEDNEFASF